MTFGTVIEIAMDLLTVLAIVFVTAAIGFAAVLTDMLPEREARHLPTGWRNFSSEVVRVSDPEQLQKMRELILPYKKRILEKSSRKSD